MNLKDLLQTHNQVSNQRKHRSTDFCARGYALLAEAEHSGFRDKAALKKAAEAFILAMRQERTCTEAYIGLGYLQLLLSDFKGAETHFRAALRYDHHNEDARKLLEFLAQKRQHPLKKQPLLAASQEAHPEQVLEQALRAALARWSGILPITPVIQAEALTALLLQQGELKQENLVFETQLEALELDCNTHELRRMLLPLHQQEVRLEKLIRVSREMVALNRLMAQQTACAESVQQQALVSAEAWQQFEQDTLDPLLDSCDQIADRLDLLSEQGYAIDSLEAAYEKLVWRLESLQAWVDEHHHV